ncbi:MAG: flagellar biosynthetic protein FliO [Zetaproteobacteria bacterium]|nr:flagellar biosynthetic protein FliO [Zetaproteobacteria bacterium]
MQENFGMMMGQSIAALALVLAIFAGLVWVLKRLQQQHLPKRHKGEAMRVVQRLSLDSQHSVVEISRGDKHYILGLSNGHIKLIEKVDVSKEVRLESETKKDV